MWVINILGYRVFGFEEEGEGRGIEGRGSQPWEQTQGSRMDDDRRPIHS